jgi:peptide deformylase
VAVYTIRTFGDPVLKQRARAVTDIDGELARIVHTMVDTMYEANGVGLAAPQVGIQRRFFTYDVGDGPAVLINPEVVEQHGEWTYDEGCLSVPGLHFELVRPKVVTVQGLDLDGEEVVVEGDELMGRMLLHEIDHLDGVLLLERLEPAARKEAMRELRRHDVVSSTPDNGASRL